MKDIKLLNFFLIFLLFAFQAKGQDCPTPALTTIDPTDEQCYQEEDGVLVFTFNDGDPPDGSNFRIRLADFDIGQVVWDDNAPFPLPNQVPAPIISGNTLTFLGLRPGDYVLALSNGDCGTGSDPTLFAVGYSGPADIGVRLEPAPFLGGAVDPAVTSVCEGSSTLLTVSGHTGTVVRWEYSSDNFISDINDLGNAGNAVFNVTGIPPGIYQFRVVIDVVDCPNQFSIPSEVTVIPLDDPSFSYPQAAYCQGDANPVAVITGLAGGTFTGPAEVVFA
ncbi:MAG: hypothetical protein KFF73_11180, partial [Cyclobacteriaceae bacterium]|nr:hypothetical protein [Cyclobacteriaceae bacterium]